MASRDAITDDQAIPRPSAGSSLGWVFIVGGIAIVVGIVFINLPFPTNVVLIGVGLAMLLLGMIITTVTRLYHRTSADLAFVRTGMGGPRVVLDGGALVLPVVHEVRWVSLSTMRFEVRRAEHDALQTADYLRTDIIAEFFLHVPRTEEAATNAARSLGSKALNPRLIEETLQMKFVSVLRQVAAEMPLEELFRNRNEFIRRVKDHVDTDIKQNGLVIENVTISRLDQTAGQFLRQDNVLDAQGARKAAEITNKAQVEINEIELQAKRDIETRTVQTDQYLAEQAVIRAQAEATRERNIQVAKATAQQESASESAERDRLGRLAEVERDKAIQLARIDQAQAADVAEQRREQAKRSAEIAKEQALAVAERQREIAIAQQEQARAAAQAAQLKAEAERAEAEQAVQTVQVRATAERERDQRVVNAEAAARTSQVQQQTQADIAAYQTIKQAEAEQQAAEKRADAMIKAAEAEQKAAELRAKGDQAIQLVPVEVRRQEVEVDRTRAQVEAYRLEQQSANESIARELQIALRQIEANEKVGVAQAQSMGEALSRATIQIFGDPSTLMRINEAFTRGQTIGKYASGLVGSAPALASGAGGLLAGIASKLGVSEEDLAPLRDALLTPSRSNGAKNVAKTEPADTAAQAPASERT